MDRYGVEPICAQLPIAPSIYFAHKARQAELTVLSNRARRDADLEVEIVRMWNENFHASGACKIGKQLKPQ